MTVMRVKPATWLFKFIPIFRVKFVVPQLPHPSAKGVRDLVLNIQGSLGICRGGALSPTEAQARGATGGMPYRTDRSLDSIALTWLSEPFLQAILIHRQDLARFRYSSVHLPVIIHLLPQLSSEPDLTSWQILDTQRYQSHKLNVWGGSGPK